MDTITYALSKKYTDNKIAESAGLHRQIVTSLPTTGDEKIIYMVRVSNDNEDSDNYNEYMWIDGNWELIGNTRVDLSDYYNKTQVDTALNGKQDTLSYDNVPTQNSNNMVKSGGIFSTMAVPKYDATNRREYYEGGAAFSGNIDSTPTAGSNNAVASGGTKTYVDNAVSQLNDEIDALSNIKVATVSATMTVSNADSTAIGGYRTISSTSKSLSSFTGFPTGKTIVAEHLYAFGANAAICGVVNVASGWVYLNTATTGDYIVRGYVFYRD